MLPITKTNDGISVLLSGFRLITVSSSLPNYDEIVDLAYSGDEEGILDILDVKEKISRLTFGNVIVTEDDDIMVDGQSVPEYLATRILQHEKDGYPIEPLIEFSRKLMKNPDEHVREDLYKWMEKGNLPVAENGNFIAFKKVRENYRSQYAPEDDRWIHVIGATLYMDREKCDPNRTNTCSRGLHFCSKDYLPNFAGSSGKIVVLEINPEHVVAIPVDYNLTKGRACQYKVIGEITDPAEIEAAYSSGGVYEDYYYDDDYEEEDDLI